MTALTVPAWAAFLPVLIVVVLIWLAIWWAVIRWLVSRFEGRRQLSKR